jgi:hypothetical protein
MSSRNNGRSLNRRFVIYRNARERPLMSSGRQPRLSDREMGRRGDKAARELL